MSSVQDHKMTPDPGRGECLLCGSTNEPTVEHIVPQTLWKRFGIDPDRDDLAQFRTTLCKPHNAATSVLHETGRAEMLSLIETGEPVSRKTLTHLGDWALWVTLLLALERGSGILGPDASRQLLLRRFDEGAQIKGIRVYAARIDELVDAADPPVTPHALALYGDARVALDGQGSPSGFSVTYGPIAASESIAVGKIALLVVGRSYSSGPDHDQRLDEAAAGVGLERIYPLGPQAVMPALVPTTISMTDLSRVFTVLPFGADLTLMPAAIQSMLSTEPAE